MVSTMTAESCPLTVTVCPGQCVPALTPKLWKKLARLHLTQPSLVGTQCHCLSYYYQHTQCKGSHSIVFLRFRKEKFECVCATCVQVSMETKRQNWIPWNYCWRNVGPLQNLQKHSHRQPTLQPPPFYFFSFKASISIFLNLIPYLIKGSNLSAFFWYPFH